MDELVKLRSLLAELKARANWGSGAPTAEEIAARDEWVRLRNQELRIERQAKEREDAKRHAANEYARTTGVPPALMFKGFGSFKVETDAQRAAIAACEEFRETWWDKAQRGEHSSLWILGPFGTGKTHLASALVTTLYLEDGVAARIVTPKALIRQLRDTWGQRGKEQALLEDLAGLDVLVLDDVGTSFGSDAEIVQLFEVIDMRYSRARPTLLTSNLSPSQLRATLGDRTYDRLRHGASAIRLRGESFRRPAEVGVA